MSDDSEETARVWRVRLSEQAADDIDAQADFLAGMQKASVADDWQNGLLETVRHLSRLPGRHPVLPPSEAVLFRRSIRHALHKPKHGGPTWRIFFVMLETGNPQEGGEPTVIVLHVRHGARGPITPDEAQAIEQTLAGEI